MHTPDYREDHTRMTMEKVEKILDPIHGFIRLTPIEKCVVSSRAFQRLHHISQLGVTFHVYPGARHSRFEHSLGVMKIASSLFQSLFPETEKESQLSYWHQVVRLGALCHDLGHLPFSHTAEEALLGAKGHEKMTQMLVQSPELSSIWSSYSKHLESDLLKVTLDLSIQNTSLTPWEKLCARLISDDNFGADRMDYLMRDAYYSGLHFGAFDFQQIIDSLTVIEENELKLAVRTQGLQAVESLWLARYLMYSRLYYHPKVRLLSIQMSRFMEAYFKDKKFPSSEKEYLDFTESTIWEALACLPKDSPDYQTLLGGNLPYIQVPLEGCVLKEGVVEATFPKGILIDKLNPGGGSREFPVLTSDQRVLSSKLAAPFLSQIPLGNHEQRLFCLPALFKDVQNFLRAL